MEYFGKQVLLPRTEIRSMLFLLGRTTMAYVRLKRIQGLVYVPDEPDDMKKHNCPDCFCCQWCSDSRCDACLKKARCNKKRKTRG